ncbi:MAG: hypothetical protein ACRD3D_12365 [Terriglobia bacterium]
MNLKILAAVLICTAGAYAQQTQATPPTVEQIMEKSIEAVGGRQALQGLTSVVMTGTTNMLAFNATGSTEVYAEAPDKFATVTDFQGYGIVGRGYDGSTGWRTDPQEGPVSLTGPELVGARMEAQFAGELRWKELYPKAQVTGRQNFGGRDCWVVELTPAEGSPVTHYYDAETFLLAKLITTRDTPQGPGKISIEFSDYRDIGNGVKLPYTLKVSIPGVGDLTTKFQTIKYNVPIDNAKFAKPAS